MNPATPPATAGELEAARLLLNRLGVSVEQLLDTPVAGQAIPTFEEYIPRVCQAVTAGTRRVYQPYWNRVREAWGERRLDEPTALEIQQLAEQTKSAVVIRIKGGKFTYYQTAKP